MTARFGLAIVAAAAVAVSGSAAPAPRFPGAETSVAVNRRDGRVAVLHGDKLQVLRPDGSSISTTEIPGKNPRVLEFCGGNLLYVTHGVSDLPRIFVVITVNARERLAFPNEGLSELFPSATSHLTLDGRGVYDFLTLDSAAREFFGLPESIPAGAGVAATYRFVGEKVLARGSDAFVGVVAFSPDDMLLTLKGGGAMRYRSPGGVAWKREGGGGNWRIADVTPAADSAVIIGTDGEAMCLDLEKGEVRWRSPGGSGRPVRDARILKSGRVLLYMGGSEQPVTIFDPATGERSADEFSHAFARLQLSSVLGYWMDRADSLAGIVELPAKAGEALLVQGADGWYEVPLQ
jgi:hypothetical protein